MIVRDRGAVVVAKVGGSLLDWEGLPGRLGAYLADRTGAGERVVLIVGGGPAADWVRGLDRLHRLGEERAHHLAIRALDLTAHALTAMMADAGTGLEVVEEAADLAAVWRSGRTPILAPRRFLDVEDRGPDPLPHCWEVTSDSIAARVAVRLRAAELALLKSAPLPPGTDRAAAARRGLIDPEFPRAAAALRLVTYLNLRESAACPVALAAG